MREAWRTVVESLVGRRSAQSAEYVQYSTSRVEGSSIVDEPGEC